MDRRKFIIGAGSLAAGGAAAIGSGAFSRTEATRAVDVAVENDDSAFLGFNLDDSTLENSEYASYENGSLQLHFDENANTSNDGAFGSGTGLNPDSTNYFDNIFQIRNQSQDDVKINIDKSNLDNPDDITFYGASLAGDNYNRDSDWSGQINAGYGVNIGVKIETPDKVDRSWETGYIVVEAYDPADSNTPS